MYYSKNGSLSIPKNYAGNTFRVIDESDRTYHAPEHIQVPQKEEKNNQEYTSNDTPNKSEIPIISTILSGISVEDILILGLIFVIHEENPNDPILFILLILLLAK